MYINKYKIILKEIINETRKKFPEVTNDILYDNGAIYYQNGNDGTDFDWKVNDCLCEFMVFYKKSEMGFIKLRVNRNGNIDIYVYNESAYTPKHQETVKNLLYSGDAQDLAATMYIIADKKKLYDTDIEKLDWKTTPKEIRETIEEILTEHEEEEEYDDEE